MKDNTKELNDLAQRVKFLEEQLALQISVIESGTIEIKSDRIIDGHIERVNKDGSLIIREYKPKYSENDLREIFGLPPLSGECYTRKKWNPPHFLQIIKNKIISQNDRR